MEGRERRSRRRLVDGPQEERDVSTLVVLGFKDKQTAEAARNELFALQKQHLIELQDAAIAVRKDDGKVELDQTTNLTGAGAMGGAFWGTLIGLIFLMPLGGAIVGAVTGAIMGHFTDLGVDDKFMKDLADSFQPGTAALFLLVIQATEDRVIEQMKQFQPTVLRTSLSSEDVQKLREAVAKA
jgi:uncharacterized membrane protein